MKKLLLSLLLVSGSLMPISVSLPSLPSITLPELSKVWPFFQRSQGMKSREKKARIAIIKIGGNGMEDSASELYQATKDRSINGILLVINSSGGSAAAFSVLHDMVKKAVTIKPVIALVTSRALSGGYMVASAAEYIIAHSHSELGSIGVILHIDRFKKPSVTDNGVEADLQVEVFSDTALKNIHDPYSQDLSDEQRDYIKSRIAVYSQSFKTLVAVNRHLDIDTAAQWADAKVFIAAEALDLNLIDEIGTLLDAEQRILELLKKRHPQLNYAADVEFIS